ncbi:MAG: hypothetical protein WB810_13865, partial [Candidatus Cybelea sp.]
PESYKIAFAALDAVWEDNRTDSLAILLGGMAINRNDEVSMDPGALSDWEQITSRAEDASVLDLILAYLDLDASRYRNVPDDLRGLINALRTEGSREREIVDSVIATWQKDPESWPLYAELTWQQPQSDEQGG